MFELVLANGKRIKTNSGYELALFYQTDGRAIVDAKPSKRKRKRNKSK
jgi:hypothetical protein